MYISGVPFAYELEERSSIINKLLFKRDSQRNFEAVKWAVNNGALLGEQGGGVPLLNAIDKNNKQAAILLLSFGANPNDRGIPVSNPSLFI